MKESLPTRERGLKLTFGLKQNLELVVAPYAGAWIEIANDSDLVDSVRVAPYAGAWIEISCLRMKSMIL